MHYLRSLAVLAALAGLLAAQTTRYVQAGATPPGNGTLAAPFPQIQPAIVASQAGDFVVGAAEGAELVVAGSPTGTPASSGPTGTDAG
jgi:hypothetical protein